MKTNWITTALVAVGAGLLFSCGSAEKSSDSSDNQTTTVQKGQSGVADEESAKNVVQVAIASADHSTLVAAVTQAELVDALSNAGPFTVFAPINAAFDALPAGTVDNLMKNENKEQLQDILQYHVYVGVIRENLIRDGMTLNQVNGANVTLGKQGDQITVNGAKVLGSVTAANGIVYVIDQVLLPK
ncbi:fasciclin domain-containing protein [Cytophagales bacterium LB-30]|uniref:Fasciclin domain-containing protein n=1 Tax=Shiella aurantiaca TaxID=3058365 RepID=A0ABT8F3I2_9BACT|nr:fasciclin domain-containing protein [Shiella aurantiaca]MDN4165015.1 fasciclin domain-containing protein [Shiella aurantiaca]